MDTKREGPAPFARAEERWMESVCWTSRSFVNALTCEKKKGGGLTDFPDLDLFSLPFSFAPFSYIVIHTQTDAVEGQEEYYQLSGKLD
jgi:hypothetical protein